MKSYRRNEHGEQAALVNWAKYRAATIPELRMLVSIPNGGKRDVAAGMKLKSEGLKAGFPDLFLYVARHGYHGLAIEMKRPEIKRLYKELNQRKGRVRQEQSDWLSRLSEQGYAVAVCFGWYDAKTLIERYLSRGKEDEQAGACSNP
jgi:hypothetical protein